LIPIAGVRLLVAVLPAVLAPSEQEACGYLVAEIKSTGSFSVFPWDFKIIFKFILELLLPYDVFY
jgi:hypothetical protein